MDGLCHEHSHMDLIMKVSFGEPGGKLNFIAQLRIDIFHEAIIEFPFSQGVVKSWQSATKLVNSGFECLRNVSVKPPYAQRIL